MPKIDFQLVTMPALAVDTAVNGVVVVAGELVTPVMPAMTKHYAEQFHCPKYSRP